MSAVKETVPPIYTDDQFTARLDHLRLDARARLTQTLSDNTATPEEVHRWQGVVGHLEICLTMVKGAR